MRLVVVDLHPKTASAHCDRLPDATHPVNSKNLPLPTTVSKLHFRNGLVRISAGIVGFLLNKWSRAERNDLPKSGFALRKRPRDFE
jgi:hypothetical protein